MSERTGCGAPIVLANGKTQCGLGYGKPWVKPPQIALCPKCRA